MVHYNSCFPSVLSLVVEKYNPLSQALAQFSVVCSTVKPYCKRWKAGRGPGNKAKILMQPLTTAQVKIPKDGQDFQIILLDPLLSVEFLEHQSLV